MLAVNYSNYREALKRYCDCVNDESEVLVITRKAGGNVVMLSEDHYNNLMENLYLRSNPANYERLMASIHQLKQGKGTIRNLKSFEEAEAADE